MNPTLVRRPQAGGKPPSIHRAAVEEAWEEFKVARLRAMQSARLEDGLRCGHAWGAFLRLFERA